MASKADFSTDEWKNIVAAAPMVGLAVTCASPNGPLGVMKEMFSMGMAMAEMIQKGSTNPLIAALIADLKERATKAEAPPDIKNAEQGKEAALQQIKQTVELLNRKVPSAEADEFKRWLMNVAQKVAEASNEGGIFGFGGQKVSEAEQQTLRQIAGILGLPTS